VTNLAQQQSTSPKKPSPLSFGAQRSSPFKRADSPLTASQPNLRPTTPTSRTSFTSPLPTVNNPPSPASSTSTVIQGRREPQIYISEQQESTPSHSTTLPHPIATSRPNSTSHNAAPSSAPSRNSARPAMLRTNTGGDPVSKLHPAQLRDMRESFQVMDRDNDGQVDREDIAEVLTQLGTSAPSLNRTE